MNEDVEKALENIRPYLQADGGDIIMANNFIEFLKKVKPIKMEEPLAATLGALQTESFPLEYSFTDVVKMAGHACPTISGAYLCCQKALERLYPGENPVRGNISVTVYGEPDEGVYGVMGQAFSFITGAAPNTGFRGLGHKFRRKDLLHYNSNKPDPEAMSFEFRRLDNDRAVLVNFIPGSIPFPVEKAKRLGELLEKILWEAAKENERREFQSLWMEKVRVMLLEQKDIDRWLQLEERRN